MTNSAPEPTLGDLLDALPADPVPQWPAVPPAPGEPGPGWAARHTDGTHHTVWTAPVPETEAADLWLRHRARFEQTGLWPVLVDEAFWQAVELEPFDTPPFPDARVLLRRLCSDHTDGEVDVIRGPQPEHVVDDRSDRQVIDGSAGTVTLVLVPARAGWVVPQLLGWDGAVNHGVMAREHTAVLGRWAGLYGAELYALNRDVACLLITRPPTDAQAALLAAAEIYAYCPDTVDQGVETLEALTSMAGSRGWWLWWD